MEKKEDTSLGMWIPTIGDELTLAKPWRFSLHSEHRNADMMKFAFNIKFSWDGTKGPDGKKIELFSKFAEVELPAGAVLKVDRIYIRKGGADMKEYDSVTFILQSLPKTKIAIPEVKDVWQSKVTNPEKPKYSKENGSYVKKTFIKKKIRFWAKLRDVNTMRFYIGKEEVEEPFVGRLIRLGEDWEGEK